MAKSTDESKAISDEIRRQYKERTEGKTFTAPLPRVVPDRVSPVEYERELREQAAKELREEQDKQLTQKMNEIRKRRGLPMLPGRGQGREV